MNDKRKREAIAIDFDGCLCANAYPDIGAPNWDVIVAARQRQTAGAGLILWTCREGKLLEEAVNAAERWGLHFDAINESLPEWKAAWGNDPRKIGATEYWDDRAVKVSPRSHAMLTNEEKLLSLAGRLSLPALMEQTAEEAAELAQAALKLSRIERGENPTPVTFEQAWNHLAEEIADVKLCIDVLEAGWPNIVLEAEKVKQEKLDRWIERWRLKK